MTSAPVFTFTSRFANNAVFVVDLLASPTQARRPGGGTQLTQRFSLLSEATFVDILA